MGIASEADDSDLAAMPAWRLHELIVSGTVSPVEVTRACLERIDTSDPTVHAFITVVADRALADARAAETAVQRDEGVGVLHGIPIAVKDEVWTAGIRSTGGSLLYENFVPEEDGAVAAQLRRAGATIIGKTNMPEFAVWPRSMNRLVPEAVNPWDPGRTSGASSGGSAAALAAGMVPLAVGSDGGGSIRIPASLCGVIGLYPTAGVVPSAGSFSYSPYASLGPMARDARDLATLMQVMAGTNTEGDYLGGLDDGVRGMRMAWTPDYGRIDVQPGLADIAHEAAVRLEAAGAIVEEPDLHIDDVWETFTIATRGYGTYGDGPSPYTQTEDFRTRCLDPGNVERLCEYNQVGLSTPMPSHTAYQRAIQHRTRLIRQVEDLFAHYDIVLSPTMPTVAPLLPEGWSTPYADPYMGTSFTGVVNLVGATAASFPCGMLDGLPVGLHIVAKPRAETTVLRVCQALDAEA